MIGWSSLGGSVHTIRGVEIKSLAFQIAVALGLALLGLRLALNPVATTGEATSARMVRTAVLLLVLWVATSLASSLWAADASLARGQALLYALSLAWAAALAWTFNPRHLAPFLVGVTAVATLTAVLCIAYFNERNPFHRPGFPLGNPGLVSAAMIPGVCAALGLAGAALGSAERRRRRRSWIAALAALAALAPMLSCLWLSGGRGPAIALFSGLACAGVLLAPPFWRVLLSGGAAAVVLGAGLLLYSISNTDLAMGRGASVRARVYAWQYAAHLWQTRPVSGCGAAAYPRVAGELAARDRELDPAAFSSEIVEHPHNELFEVLTEIGLVGGITFVGGFLATAAAAYWRITRDRERGAQRWLMLAPVAALAALVADALVGVNPRLPGGAALLTTMLGVVWAVARSGPRPPLDGAPQRPSSRSPAGWLPPTAAFAAALAAAGASAFDWIGVQHEYAADRREQRGDLDRALRLVDAAEQQMLDPVRRIAARQTALRLRLKAARAELDALESGRVGDAAAWHSAIERCRAVYDAALALRASVPSLERNDAIAATAAEWLAAIYLHHGQTSLAAEQRSRAERAWYAQRERTRFDRETAMAMLRHAAPLSAQLALLRDALRFGEADGEWLDRLAAVSRSPDFEQALGAMVAAVSPLSTQAQPDALMVAAAPETYRLAAAYHAQRGQHESAVGAAAAAARLYRVLAPRLPDQAAMALAEQSDWIMAASIARAGEALAVLHEAQAALPAIQAQKLQALARPIVSRRVRALLAAGREGEARRAAATLVVDANQALAVDTNRAPGAPDDLRVDALIGEAYVTLLSMYVRKPTTPDAAARAWAAAATRLAPGDVWSWGWSAWLHARAGESDAAATTLRTARAAGVPDDLIARIREGLCGEFPAACTELGG